MAAGGSNESPGELSLAKVIVWSWLLLGVLTSIAWLGYTPFHARSVFIGGAMANISFLLLKRDLIKLLSGPLDSAKLSFFMRYYLRLSVVAGVLFLLVKYRLVNALALLAGLSTVLLGIGLAVMAAVKTIYENNNAAKG